MHKSRKPKAFKNDVNKLAQLETEVAQLRTENEKLKKATGASKVQDAYYRRAYNMLVDYAVS